jgi:alkanesulfonate monooxygenase SsuD/methylene tetrahydromethanopterin reductase-like flavin-dependent oxidoreductase (luciferase family)
MRYGFVLPQGDASDAANLAREAEVAGWDGFFVWDPVWGVDPWVALAAAAMVTERIRLGTMLTPVSRRRPWKLASETATLDRLSRGRVILAVGLGAIDTGFAEFGEETDRKTRAELLDEGLAIIEGLWRGQPFAFEGKHYRVRPTSFSVPPPPVQTPRIPVWVVGAWPSPRSMRRVLHWDGLLPNKRNPDGTAGRPTPDDVRAMKAWVEERRTATTPFDVVVEGETPGDDAVKSGEIVRPWAEAGATWWLEAMWSTPELDQVRERIRQGPPRLTQ